MKESDLMGAETVKKQYETACVVDQHDAAGGVKDLVLSCSAKLAKEARPGQFVSLYCRDGARLLPRPISICDVERGKERIRFVYRVAGEGTKEFAALSPGDTLQILGPLGNGYDLREAAGKRVLLVGGGLGVPPMLYLSKCLAAAEGKEAPQTITSVVGYRDAGTVFLDQEMSETAATLYASDDGSFGRKGTVLDVIREEALSFDVLYACGPLPMLRALAGFTRDENREGKNIKCYVSLEERMACGVGACLGCVTKTAEPDEHSRVRNARICVEGPVFDADVIAW